MKTNTRVINLPNIISLGRVLLTPIFVIYLMNHLFLLALIVFTIGAVSDGLDGLFARYLNQKTALGAYLDPIADKLLLSSAYISLAVLQIIPSWLTVIIISRDILIIIGVAIFIIMNVKFEIKPRFSSKMTTVVQLVTIFVILLYNVIQIAAMKQYAPYLFAFTAGLTIISGLHYIYVGLNILQDESGNHQTP